MTPKVTFVVPCYKLANLLPECLDSILAQTFNDFEVLVMDDCSPDATPEVVRSYRDERVKHIRNEKNLKHLANYNKGIGMASGEYVWLISADDRLRKPYVLERYVRLMEGHPQVGYVYCPVIALRNDQECEVLPWSSGGALDRIVAGREFLLNLLPANCISAPSAMARTECYRKADFPLDMPYAGDWYLWCLFALSHDVAYMAEPMVCYRLHDKSFTSVFSSDDTDVIAIDEINVRWRIMSRAEEAGCPELAAKCLDYVIDDYAMRLFMKQTQNHRQGLTQDGFEKSLQSNADKKSTERYVRAKVAYALGNNYFADKNPSYARRNYARAIQEKPSLWKAWLKYAIATIQNSSTRKITSSANGN